MNNTLFPMWAKSTKDRDYHYFLDRQTCICGAKSNGTLLPLDEIRSGRNCQLCTELLQSRKQDIPEVSSQYEKCIACGKSFPVDEKGHEWKAELVRNLKNAPWPIRFEFECTSLRREMYICGECISKRTHK